MTVSSVTVGDEGRHGAWQHSRRKHTARVAPPFLKSAHFFGIKGGVSNILSFVPELSRARSVWGKSRRFVVVRPASALPPKADIYRTGRHVSKAPIAANPASPRFGKPASIFQYLPPCEMAPAVGAPGPSDWSCPRITHSQTAPPNCAPNELYYSRNFSSRNFSD